MIGQPEVITVFGLFFHFRKNWLIVYYSGQLLGLSEKRRRRKIENVNKGKKNTIKSKEFCCFYFKSVVFIYFYDSLWAHFFSPPQCEYEILLTKKFILFLLVGESRFVVPIHWNMIRIQVDDFDKNVLFFWLLCFKYTLYLKGKYYSLKVFSCNL